MASSPTHPSIDPAIDAGFGPVAEFNRGRLRYGWDDPRSAEFADALDRVNAVAMRSPGFVWMLPEEEMDAVQRDPEGPLGGDNLTASTLSVWESVAHLRAFVFETVHARFMRRRDLWFEPHAGPSMVIWPVAPGHRPSIAEAQARLDLLTAEGPSAEAFGWAETRPLQRQ
ncbi:MAG: DUF3291 domain-containing protein [Pseudomonadota bacterium]